MTHLFSGSGSDPHFLAVRDYKDFADIKDECKHLWSIFKPFADSQFAEEFSRNFNQRFWEMYLMTQLSHKHGEPQSPTGKGPDFKFREDPFVCVEATVAERGNPPNAVPDISQRGNEDDFVPFEEVILRITTRLAEKVKSNDAKEEGNKYPYIIAINLPFPEAWICNDPPLSAQACLGISGALSFEKNPDDTGRKIYTPKLSIEKGNEALVDTTSFTDIRYAHVSALVIAAVNPFSTSYRAPAIELLHNPKARNPLPRGWSNIGVEYWIEDNRLRQSSTTPNKDIT